jgi:hypothetical protein
MENVDLIVSYGSKLKTLDRPFVSTVTTIDRPG